MRRENASNVCSVSYLMDRINANGEYGIVDLLKHLNTGERNMCVGVFLFRRV